MSIIAFIEDHKVIDKIIDHLKLTFMAERPPPPQRLQQELCEYISSPDLFVIDYKVSL